VKDRATLYRYLKTGRLKGWRLGPGNRWLIDLDSIEALKKGQP